MHRAEFEVLPGPLTTGSRVLCLRPAGPHPRKPSANGGSFWRPRKALHHVAGINRGGVFCSSSSSFSNFPDSFSRHSLTATFIFTCQPCVIISAHAIEAQLLRRLAFYPVLAVSWRAAVRQLREAIFRARKSAPATTNPRRRRRRRWCRPRPK